MNHYLKYFFILSIAIVSCNQKNKNTELKYSKSPINKEIPVYSFAIHPLHNPAKLMKSYQPLIDYLNSQIKGASFTLEASRNYGSYEEKIKSQKPEFLLPNPWQTLLAIKSGYHVVAMAGESDDFKGLFIVRKNTDIKVPQDLKGKAVSYPAPTALAACIMPQYFLYRSGINISTDIENRYVGSQESSIMNVYIGQTAVGATWPPPWRAFQKDHPREASALKVIWETEPLINNSVMIRNDIPMEIQEQVQKILASLDKVEPGKKILANIETARFIPATDKDYEVVRVYVERFEKEVRIIDIK